MLVELRVSNLAIIDELSIRLHDGFNALTGETGAGKSIIVDAVGALLGGRVTDEFVRSGADAAYIEGIFQASQLLPLLAELGLESDEDALILSREIRRGGRNVCRVNGRAVTATVLRTVAQGLIDIHGQSEHLSLLRVNTHLDLLDRYAGLGEQRQQVAQGVVELRQVRRELDGLLSGERELARRVDLLTFQVDEIAAARLHEDEEEELRAERRRLANAERLAQVSDQAYRALYESEDEAPSATDRVGEAQAALDDLCALDPDLAELLQQAEALAYQVEALAEGLRDYRDAIEFDPPRLHRIEDRLELVLGLQRKYGDSIADVLAFAARAQDELDSITHAEERIEALRAADARLRASVGAQAAVLSADRSQAADRLASAVEAQLADLNMAGAHFCVDLRQEEAADGLLVGDRSLAFDATGVDQVEFLIAPNVGEPPKPLARIASGGEMSRLMLALKTILTQVDQVPTLIFDEIDVGVGGRSGAVIGEKLSQLTGAHQVLCVTHLPQIAAYADTHYAIVKSVSDGRTVTRVQPLAGRERLTELAVMLGGAPASEVSRRDAQAMLDRAKKARER
ncbi:MAG: DNA repair protein RecN [Chloroflexi bacterium]|nr:DNA repair protein RecN [Chloroflexota bacterium]